MEWMDLMEEVEDSAIEEEELDISHHGEARKKDKQ